MTQNNLGATLNDLGTRSGGEAGRKLLEKAAAAYRCALEVDCGDEWTGTISGQLCWTSILAGQFPEALVAGEKAVSLSGDAPCPARMNLAHAYLFNGQSEKAKAIYIKYKGQSFENGRKWNDEVVNDFKTLRQAGHDHPDMKKIEAQLQKTTGNPTASPKQ